MNALVLDISLLLAQGLLATAMCLAVLRMLLGPRAQDRVMALDVMYVAGMLLFLIIGMRSRSLHFFDAALIVGILGFVATAALGRFLLRGEVIE